MGSTSPVSVDKEDSQIPIITWPKDAETQVVEVTNPCPAGYRLPTEAELDAERQSWSSDNAAGASMHGFERNIYLHKVDIIKAAGIF